jgi:hypothetical protein
VAQTSQERNFQNDVRAISIAGRRGHAKALSIRLLFRAHFFPTTRNSNWAARCARRTARCPSVILFARSSASWAIILGTRQRSTSVAFGAKRTSTEKRIYKYTS